MSVSPFMRVMRLISFNLSDKHQHYVPHCTKQWHYKLATYPTMRKNKEKRFAPDALLEFLTWKKIITHVRSSSVTCVIKSSHIFSKISAVYVMCISARWRTWLRTHDCEHEATCANTQWYSVPPRHLICSSWVMSSWYPTKRDVRWLYWYLLGLCWITFPFLLFHVISSASYWSEMVVTTFPAFGLSIPCLANTCFITAGVCALKYYEWIH